MPTWVKVYLFFILIGGLIGIFTYRSRGVYFIVGESFSLLFTFMIFLYYYDLYPKPSSILVPIMMFLYIIYWEFVENFKIFKQELKNEIKSKEELNIVIITTILFILPIFYIGINLFLKF